MAKKDDFTGFTDDERRAKGRAPDPLMPGQKAPKADPPRLVNVSFWLWVAAALVLVAGQIVMILLKQQLVDVAVKQNADAGQHVALAQVQSNVTSLVWEFFVGGLCFAALIVLFAYKAREGTRSARTVVTVLAVISILFQYLLIRSVFSIGSSLLMLAALALLYLPSVAGYFPKVGKRL